jgi:predicted NodU family carbamoyl transferase
MLTIENEEKGEEDALQNEVCTLSDAKAELQQRLLAAERATRQVAEEKEAAETRSEKTLLETRELLNVAEVRVQQLQEQVQALELSLLEAHQAHAETSCAASALDARLAASYVHLQESGQATISQKSSVQ